MALTAAGAVAQVGTIDQAHIDYAADLKESMPRPLTDAVRDPLGAQAMVFALLLDPGETVRHAQLAWLDAYALPAAVRETRMLSRTPSAWPPRPGFPWWRWPPPPCAR